MNPESPYAQSLVLTKRETLDLCRTLRNRFRIPKPFWGVTALQLQALELPLGMEEMARILHLSVPSRGQFSRIEGAQFHVWRPLSKPVVIDRKAEVTAASPFEALLQLSSLISIDEIVVLFETLRHSRLAPPVSALATIGSNNSSGGKTTFFLGQKKCRQAAQLVREGSQSSWETRLRLHLVRSGLPEPVIQFTSHDMMWDEDHPMQFDLAYPQWRILIEYDGMHHFTDPEQRRRDIQKTDCARLRGWQVLRISAHDFTLAPDLVRSLIKT